MCNRQNVDHSFVAFQRHKAIARIDVYSVSRLVIPGRFLGNIDMALLCHEVFCFGIPAQSKVVVLVGSDEEVVGL